MTAGTDGKKRPNILMIPVCFMGHTPAFVHLIHQVSLKYAGEATVTVLSSVEDFADDLGVIWIPLYTLPMWLGLSFIYAPKLYIQPRHSPQPIDLPGLEMFRHSDPPYEVWCEKDFLWEHRKYVEQSGGIMVNTPEYIETEVGAITEFRAHLQRTSTSGKVPVIYTMGPRNEIPGFGVEYRSKLSSFSVQDQECLRWLDKQSAKSVLYIAFGTLANLKTDEVSVVARGLEASGAKYLWNLKIPAGSSLEACLPAGFLERTSDHGFLLTGWAPQVKILQHPSLGGFMTHCGWNSTTESLCSGIPLIAAPVFADQCLNARVVTEKLNVGVALTPGYKHDGYEISSTEVEKAIKTLMFDDIGREIRKNAEEEQKRLLATMAPGGTTYEMTEAFLKLITTV
ncbi:hypothetical protein AXG93_3310s1140 [Marchantia polymorpha subsp. ruderalis]|uniref:Uncharacterized protein n=1 Tax=Marchantia polymorpha subsp. ruderalis TaxID=1480154 RepID=A0A176W2M7_MARPO|nr:hypothetical protein AXG93_3310s1140 [Marchantia polymorpha subsp. ruderalis]